MAFNTIFYGYLIIKFTDGNIFMKKKRKRLIL